MHQLSIVDLLRFARAPLAELVRLQRAHGDVIALKTGGKTLWLLSEPEEVRRLLRMDGEHFIKGEGNAVLEPLIGEGLFLAEGQAWKLKRALAQDALRRGAIERFCARMNEAAARLCQRWREQGQGDGYLDVRRATLGLTSRTLVGVEAFAEDEARHARLDQAWLDTNKQLHPVLRWTKRARSKKRIKALREEVAELIARRARGDEVLARLEESGELTDVDVLDEAVTLLLAGQECMPISIAWSLHLLSTHPEVQDAIRDELEGAPAELDTAALGELRVLKRLLNEALRLYPPAWLISREATTAVELSGHTIEAGDLVVISPWVVHRHEGYWARPDAFDLAHSDDKRGRVAFMPFATGPRVCVGMAFADTVARIFLAHIVRSFVLSPAGAAPRPSPGLSLRPDPGVPLRLQAR